MELVKYLGSSIIGDKKEHLPVAPKYHARVMWKGKTEDLYIHEVIYSESQHTWWLIYGVINESLGGELNDMLFTSYRIDQWGNGSYTQIQGESFEILECKILVEESAIKDYTQGKWKCVISFSKI